jgi:very-short-patch-repair endonuclease
MTLPEVILWGDLRGGRLNGLRFRRQHGIGPYVLDFFLPSHRIAVEVDGQGHGHPDQIRHDQRRDAWLAEQGIVVLRFAATAVLDDDEREGVLETIARAAAPSTASGGPPPP